MDSEQYEKFSSMTLVELKAKLRERGIKVSGKKKSLVDRLVFFDTIGKKLLEPEPEYCMQLPDPSLFKDIHGGIREAFPPCTADRITEYLSCSDKKIEKKIEDLYKERYVRYIRSTAKNDLTFIKGNVWAEMRKATSYGVEISLNRDGVVVKCQCECAVGQGPTAHCKHVICILYGLAHFKKTWDVLTEITCTQVLQKFHQAKPHKGSPIKCKQFGEVRGKSKSLIYDPRPLKKRNVPGKEDTWRNAIINHQGRKRMPISQLFPPADIESLTIDHDYMKPMMEEDFLIKLKVSAISDLEVRETEVNIGRRANQNCG
ncbi:uncharacterized protein LOC141907787 [Tubulanus polymorphus]|uniref:uncharacterized protein LOC141907787 n=1 Tax=Tubulanus polymorphus TaxID=672921 RepID=UPI003DA26F0A